MDEVKNKNKLKNKDYIHVGPTPTFSLCFGIFFNEKNIKVGIYRQKFFKPIKGKRRDPNRGSAQRALRKAIRQSLPWFSRTNYDVLATFSCTKKGTVKPTLVMNRNNSKRRISYRNMQKSPQLFLQVLKSEIGSLFYSKYRMQAFPPTRQELEATPIIIDAMLKKISASIRKRGWRYGTPELEKFFTPAQITNTRKAIKSELSRYL